MHRRSRTAFLLTGLVCLALLVGCEQDQWHVDGRASGLLLGTSERPFRTIGAAMARACAGDVIYVEPGLYRENLRLKPGVALVSLRTGAAILHGGAEREGGLPAVTMADGARLSGFTVTGGFNGVLCEGGAPVIERNIVRGNHGDAGLSLLAGCAAHVLNNTVLGNLGSMPHGVSRGIYVEDSAPTLRNNIVTGNDVGIQVYRARPVERHNLYWNNRQHLGGGLLMGEGSLVANPVFRDEASDDWRLNANSPARHAGDPRWEFNDRDGSRSDMGAFDGDGGYRVGLPAQAYFVESLLGAVDTREGPRLNGTSRLQRDLLFWFDSSGRNTQGAHDAWLAISRAVPVLTAGRYRARLHNSETPPVLGCLVVKVRFDRPPRGMPYRLDARGGCLDTNGVSVRAGAEITGGELDLGSWQQGLAYEPAWVATLEHELGHVLGLLHAYRGDLIMGQPSSLVPGFKAVEREAFDLLYRHPTGMHLGGLLDLGELTADVLHPFPRIDQVLRWDTSSGRWMGASSQGTESGTGADAWARPGDYLLLEGSRLTLRWMTEVATTLRPPDHAPPQVSLSGRFMTVDLERQRCEDAPADRPCARGEPSNSFQGRPSRYLKWRVPEGARSGWLVVHARGQASNPVWLEIR